MYNECVHAATYEDSKNERCKISCTIDSFLKLHKGSWHGNPLICTIQPCYLCWPVSMCLQHRSGMTHVSGTFHRSHENILHMVMLHTGPSQSDLESSVQYSVRWMQICMDEWNNLFIWCKSCRSAGCILHAGGVTCTIPIILHIYAGVFGIDGSGCRGFYFWPQDNSQQLAYAVFVWALTQNPTHNIPPISYIMVGIYGIKGSR